MARPINKKEKIARARVLSSKMTFDENYEPDDSFIPSDPSNPMEAHTTHEMIECMMRNPSIELDAKILDATGRLHSLDRDTFLKTLTSSNHTAVSFNESNDSFDFDHNSGGPLIGQDSNFLIGGPFYKNLYFYQDYIRMHSAAFYAYHHDPIGKAIVTITRDFTLGRGFRVDSKNQKAAALWKIFEQANDLYEQIDMLSIELSCYGETMIWWLPNHETKITYRLNQDEIPHGLIPRVKLIDPSNIIEIITYPEDISRKIAYVWLAPTQYQIYSNATVNGAPQNQPTTKFIYRQIPAEEMLHYKVNAVSNEKRGRSDLFPVLGFMKRLRDSVNYSIVALQKQSAWAIDTTIKGSQDDIEAYVNAQQAQGPTAPAGSEFVHTEAITRQFLANTAGKGGNSEAFEWSLSMIAIGSGIPTSYFGTHMSGGQTRASAVVATEPVAKKFEMRQRVLERIIHDLWDKLMAHYGIIADCEITFPEVITQDRSAKLKDLALAESQGWIAKKRAAEIAAKELGIDEFDYQQEQAKTENENETNVTPLTSPGLDKSSAITSDERRDIKKNYAN